MISILFGTFILLVILGTPIAVSVGLASIASVFYSGVPLVASVQRLFTAVDSFPLLAIPFFMLAGKLMEFGGISKRLINVANDLIGFISGGMGVVSTLACMFFGAISGSSTGTVAAIGSIMIPAMKDNGYNEKFASALIATSGSLGILIPPSIPMIIYGVVIGVSIADLFIAGIGVGLLCGLLIIVYTIIRSRISGYKGVGNGLNLANFFTSVKKAFLAILMPVLVLGGIYGGIFTPTEAATIACLYGFVVGYFVYKEFTLKELPQIILSSAQNTAVVMFIIATSSLFGWIITINMVPQKIASLIFQFTSSGPLILTAMLLFLVLVGTFMEGNAYIIILAPLFAPIAMELGIDLVHFGIVMVISVCVGTITPPLGVNLFTTCSIYGLKIEDVVREILPFIIIMTISLFLVTFIPAISLFLVDLGR